MMKNNVLIFVLSIISIAVTNAQTTHTYTYDANGNRISRVIELGAMKNAEPKDIFDEEAKALALELEEATSFTDQISETDITIYPNPTKGQMVVKVDNLPEESGRSGIQIYDLQGRLVYESKKLTAFNNVDITHVRVATYVMRIYIGDQTTEWKVVKN